MGLMVVWPLGDGPLKGGHRFGVPLLESENGTEATLGSWEVGLTVDDRAAGSLGIVWADGHDTTYDTTTLRWLCPCAFCRGEAGMPGWLDSGPTLTDEQTRLVDVSMVGGYAIAPAWADGHHTGYYTFTMLRDRCPCPDCSARREAATAGVGADRHEEHA